MLMTAKQSQKDFIITCRYIFTHTCTCILENNFKLSVTAVNLRFSAHINWKS